MSRRLSHDIRQVVGSHVSLGSVGEYRAEDRTFSIVRVPLPPTGKISRVLIPDKYPPTIRETVDLHVACPHCLEDVHFSYVSAEARLDFARDAMREIDRYSQRERAGLRMLEADFWLRSRDSRQQATTGRWLEAMEEWNAANDGE